MKKYIVSTYFSETVGGKAYLEVEATSKADVLDQIDKGEYTLLDTNSKWGDDFVIHMDADYEITEDTNDSA